MKSTIIYGFAAASALTVGITLSSCNDYLDKEPLSNITPEQYFNTEADLQYYANGLYTTLLPGHGNYGGSGGDVQTDNMSALGYDDAYVPGKRKTITETSNIPPVRWMTRHNGSSSRLWKPRRNSVTG